MRPDFAKVSLGAEKTLDWECRKNISEVIDELKSQEFKIISLEQHPKAKKLKSGDKEQGLFALIVGNEVDGVSKEALDASDEIVEIDMLGSKESLNVSVATGVALFVLL